MKLTDVQISISTLGAIAVVVAGWIFWASQNVVLADDLQQFTYRQAIKDDRQWIEILEQKLEQEKDANERQKIERQIESAYDSLNTNMEKIK